MIFEGVLLYIGMVAIFDIWPGLFNKYIGSPFKVMLPIKFGFDWPSHFSEEDL